MADVDRVWGWDPASSGGRYSGFGDVCAACRGKSVRGSAASLRMPVPSAQPISTARSASPPSFRPPPASAAPSQPPSSDVTQLMEMYKISQTEAEELQKELRPRDSSSPYPPATSAVPEPLQPPTSKPPPPPTHSHHPTSYLPPARPEPSADVEPSQPTFKPPPPPSEPSDRDVLGSLSPMVTPPPSADIGPGSIALSPSTTRPPQFIPPLPP